MTTNNFETQNKRLQACQECPKLKMLISKKKKKKKDTITMLLLGDVEFSPVRI